MRLSHIAVILMLLAVVCLVGCDKSIEPTLEPTVADDHESDLENLQAAAWPRTGYGTPSPLVTVDIGIDALEFWPYTTDNLPATPQDPINLIFFGEADPRDIRAALFSLDGDRTAYGMDPIPPFNSTWDDAMGDVQASYGEPDGWAPGAIQLACGDYSQARFHLRLFKIGKWTVGGAHFEVLIPGTTDHQVLSWELAEQFIIVDFMRSNLLDPDLPMIPAGPINESPFRTIPAMIYNGLPVELRGLIGGPLGDVTDDVPIGTDGQALVLNLAGKVDRVPEVRQQNLLIDFDQTIPKPFCASGPYDYIYVTGPVTLIQTTELTVDGTYQSSFHAEGELSVLPIDGMTGQPNGEPLTARVKEIHNSLISRGVASGASLRLQSLNPFRAPGSGWFFERFRVSTKGGNGYQIVTRCESNQVASQGVIAKARAVDIEGGTAAKRLVSIR